MLKAKLLPLPLPQGERVLPACINRLKNPPGPHSLLWRRSISLFNHDQESVISHPMHLSAIRGVAIIFGASLLGSSARATPLALHPSNPHYFLFRGKPTVLITSGEHYGAVLNPDFDYTRYLETLKADGLNLTRTFTGAYVEPAGTFHIASNTLAPAFGRFICPWARSET